MLPLRSGLDVCRDIRAAGLVTPILLLSARSETIDKVVGLKLGADDYVSKPFEAAELLARIEALLRRVPMRSGQGIHQFGTIRVDLKRSQVMRGGTSRLFVCERDAVAPLLHRACGTGCRENRSAARGMGLRQRHLYQDRRCACSQSSAKTRTGSQESRAHSDDIGDWLSICRQRPAIRPDIATALMEAPCQWAGRWKVHCEGIHPSPVHLLVSVELRLALHGEHFSGSSREFPKRRIQRTRSSQPAGTLQGPYIFLPRTLAECVNLNGTGPKRKLPLWIARVEQRRARGLGHPERGRSMT